MARPEPVREILATLKREHLPPVYGFVNGFRIAQFPYQEEILKAWLAAGNPLGNHTFSHPALDQTPADKYIADIAANEKYLQQVDPTGNWHWFRYPFLEEGNTLVKRQAVRFWLLDHHYQIAEVTLDFEDSLWNEPYARCMTKQAAGADESAHLAWLEETYLGKAAEFTGAFRTLSHQLYGRDIPYVLLLHVGAFDAKMLPKLIAQFRSEGFTFTTLEAAEQDPAYAFDPNLGYPGGGTLMELVSQIKKVNFPDNSKPYKQLDRLCR
jgi:peptidoglycan/xylan/chitin deacetylase (PgdA/CDA1 family)